MHCLLFVVILNFFALNNAHSQEIVKDSSFEAGRPNAYWQEYSVNFNGVICNSLCGNCAGKCIPRSGSYFVWLGGSSSAPETSIVSQNIFIPQAQKMQLQFYLKIPYFSENLLDNMTVWIDSTHIYSIGGDSTNRFKSAYLPVNIDISNFADNSMHNLRFVGYQNANPSTSTFLLDDISIKDLTDGIDLVEHILDWVETGPNPASDNIQIHLRSDISTGFTCKIYDSKGAQVIESSESQYEKDFQIDVSKLDSGAYFLVISSKESTSQYIKKFIKQ